MNLVPYLVLWSVLAVLVLALALYRRLLTFHGDDEYLHLAASEERMIPHQVALGRRLALIDRWGKLLTVCTAAFGLIIAAVVLFQAYQSSFQIR